MTIAYLQKAQEDLLWMHRYYRTVFPEGRNRAYAHFRASEKLLAENPQIGRVISSTGTRELAIAKTPFSLIYRIEPDGIEVLRIFDGRSDRISLGIQ